MDERIRELQRAAEGGDPAARRSLLSLANRSGVIGDAQYLLALRLLGWLGDPAARSLLRGRGEEWLQKLGPDTAVLCGNHTVGRLAIAAARFAIASWKTLERKPGDYVVPDEASYALDMASSLLIGLDRFQSTEAALSSSPRSSFGRAFPYSGSVDQLLAELVSLRGDLLSITQSIRCPEPREILSSKIYVQEAGRQACLSARRAARYAATAAGSEAAGALDAIAGAIETRALVLAIRDGKMNYSDGSWRDYRRRAGADVREAMRRAIVSWITGGLLPKEPSLAANPTYYHGTREEHLEKIREDGLSHPFLASEVEQARCWGRSYSNDPGGSDVRVLEVEIPDEDMGNVVPDYNLMDPHDRHRILGVKPDDYFDVRSELHRHRWLRNRAHKAGINSVPDRECGGEASIYLGDVPPEQVSLVTSNPGTAADALVAEFEQFLASHGLSGELLDDGESVSVLIDSPDPSAKRIVRRERVGMQIVERAVLGHFDGQRLDDSSWSWEESCRRDLEETRRELGDPDLGCYLMTATYLAPSLKGRQIAWETCRFLIRYLYEAHHAAVVPHDCVSWGSVSPDAKRVLARIRAEFAGVGSVFAGASRAPALRRNANVLPFYCATCGEQSQADSLGNLPEACETCGTLIPYLCPSCRDLVPPDASGRLPEACPHCGDQVVFARSSALDPDFMPLETVGPSPEEIAEDLEEVQRAIEDHGVRRTPSGRWSAPSPKRRRRVDRPPQPPKTRPPLRRRGRWPQPRYVTQVRGSRRMQVPVCSTCDGNVALERVGSRALRCPRCQAIHADPGAR